MTAHRSRVHGLAVLAACLALVAGLLAVPSAALAATVSFGQPQAIATYDEKIVFTVDVTTDVPLERVELRMQFPQALGPALVDVTPPRGTGHKSLSYTLDLTGAGHIVPNTPIVATWAAYPTAGADPILSQPETFRYEDSTKEWRSVKGDLMTVHWYAGTRAFAEKALRIGEQAIKDTSTLLGVTETDPVDFYIYGDEASFRQALGPGTRENVGGQAHSDIRTLFALIGPDEIDASWVGIVVPHELVHLVFDTAVHNPYRFPPRWLNEGLAVYLSQGFAADDRQRVRQAAGDRTLMPLVALGGQFPTDPDQTLLAYAESVSAIDYLVRKDGQSTLVDLVKAYADGLTDDEAFTKATGSDLAAFQAGWLADLGATEPTRYGPQPAPPGPLPPGWAGPAPTAVAGASPAAVAQAGASPGTSGGAVPAPTAIASAPLQADPNAGGAWLPILVVLGVALVVVVAGLFVARRRERASGA